MTAIQDHVCYLGFVIDSSQPDLEKVTHALLSLQDNLELWYVIDLSALRYDAKLKNCVGRYFKTVFSLSVQTWLNYQLHKKLQKNEPIYKNKNFTIEKITSYLRDMDRSDKVTAASPHFPKIRKAIHRSMFHSMGEKRSGMQLVWKGSNSPYSIFFWSLSEFQTSLLKDAQGLPFGTFKVKNLRPQCCSLKPENLARLAESLLLVQEGCSWQELYLKALIQNAEIEDLIDFRLSSATASKAVQVQPSHSSQPPNYGDKNSPYTEDMLKSRIRAVVVGPSGSGKSTFLKRLAAGCARNRAMYDQKTPFPILVKIDSFGDNDNTSVNQFYARSISESLSSLSTSELCRWHGAKARRNRQKSWTHTGLIEAIRDEVNQWLDEKSNLSTTVLLVDGLSEVSPEYEYILLRQFRDSLEAFYGVFVATKRIIPFLDDLNFKTILALEPLTGQQIKWFLARRYPDKGGSITLDLAKQHPQLFKLIQRPFFLKIFREILDPEQPATIPSTEGRLIESFIAKSIERKLDAGEVSRRLCPPAKFNYYLAQLAKKLINEAALGRSSYVRYPADLVDLSYDQRLDEILHLGESFGILSSSGLHFDKRQDQGRITFEHDLFRDYYAALWLIQAGIDEFSSAEWDSLLEYRIWDTPLKMYFELSNESDYDLNLVVRAVSERDPYLATECIQIRDNWSHETVNAIFSLLRCWEFDMPTVRTGFFTSSGIQAAKILLSRLPAEELVNFYRDEITYSLQYIAVPEVLVTRADTDKPTMLKLMARHYNNDRSTYLRAITLWDNPLAFKMLVAMIDDIIVSGKVDLWSDKAAEYMQIVFSSSYQPNYDFVNELEAHIKSTFVKQLLYFKAECSRPQLEDLRRHSDPIIQALAAFKISYVSDPKFKEFAKCLSQLKPSCLSNPLLYFLVVAVACTCSEHIEGILKKWLDNARASKESYSNIRNTVDAIAACSTSSACEALSQVLLSEANLAFKLLSGDASNLNANPCSQLIIEKLKLISSGQLYHRSLFVRFALGDNLDVHELADMYSSLIGMYADAIMSSKCHHEELELSLMCLLKRPSWRHEVIDGMDNGVLANVAPNLIPLLIFKKERDVFMDKLAKKTVEHCESALEMLVENTAIARNVNLDDAFLILYRGCCQCGEIDFVIKVLWQKIKSLINEKRFGTAHKLAYIAWRFESVSGRRWLSVRGSQPFCMFKTNYKGGAAN
ncbi:MAG: hypothetical protein NTX52_14260 [Planctomycetota bacterium]|nr:hypothetical protein [Planctomycetota bacterium]